MHCRMYCSILKDTDARTILWCNLLQGKVDSATYCLKKLNA